MRGGIRTVIIPEENRKDLADIPKNVTQAHEDRAGADGSTKCSTSRWSARLTPWRVAEGVEEVRRGIRTRRRQPRMSSIDVLVISLENAAETRAVAWFFVLRVPYPAGITATTAKQRDTHVHRGQPPIGKILRLHAWANPVTTIQRTLFRTGSSNPMNKTELIDAVAENADLSKADAGRAVDAVVGSITKAP